MGGVTWAKHPKIASKERFLRLREIRKVAESAKGTLGQRKLQRAIKHRLFGVAIQNVFKFFRVHCKRRTLQKNFSRIFQSPQEIE